MAKILNQRPIDWVTAPGDQYSYMHCPPPPCSDSLYYSSLWISTTGTVTVQEVAPPGTDPNAVSPEEAARFRQWAFQQVIHGLGHEALMEAEDQLGEKFEVMDVTLGPKAQRLMSAAFKIRADKLTGSGGSTAV
jgi:hypothetical protein